MVSLETDRLRVRSFRADDAEALHAIIARYAASEVAAYDQPWPTSLEEIRQVTAWFASGDRFLAVCLKPDETLIGFVALSPEGEAEPPTLNLGYVFHEDYHGRGYAAEACRAAIAYAFGELRASRLVSGTAAANVASCRLLERLGFRKVAEQSGSFQTAADGTPITFLGYTYELSSAAQ